MRKKVDKRVRILVENAVASHHRGFFVIIGDRGRDQLVNLHYLQSKIYDGPKRPILWCYKKELGFSSHRTKRAKMLKRDIKRGKYNPDVDDPFELFISAADIRYCYYKDSEQILGKTYGMCVLQDFEALTPNLLCRTIETVAGGGLIVLLLKTMSSLKQLYAMTMDSHNKFRRDDKQDIEPRFNERFILSLGNCESCLVVDDELNILPLSKYAASLEAAPKTSSNNDELDALKEDMKETQPLGSLLKVAKTMDQAKALMSFVDVISEKTLRQTVSLTAGRGRGKSAALGLSLAACIAYGYSNLFVTAPHPSNLQTVFEFLLKGFDALGLTEHQHYDIVQAEAPELEKALIRVNVFKDHRQTVQYIAPQDCHHLSQAEVLVIDEAAAIPIPVVRKLLGPYLVMMASTINGYEGTGRALSLKLIQELKQPQKLKDRSLKELELKEPIRYGPNDAIEKWLHKLLCLDSTTAKSLKGFPMPDDCKLYRVSRDALFSFHKASEIFLESMVSLFVSSHYKNTPNDLLLMSDNPTHELFVLCGPTEEGQLPEVLVAIQIACEGSLSVESVQNALKQGHRPSGDLLPWTISQHFADDDFPKLAGIRIVRIACHPSLQRKGYGSRALSLLIEWLDRPECETAVKKTDVYSEDALLTEELKPRESEALLTCVENMAPSYSVDYCGTSFGVTVDLYHFWSKAGYVPVYVRQQINDVTGEHSLIMLRTLEKSKNKLSLSSFVEDFRRRFIKMASGPFRHLSTTLSLALLGEGEQVHQMLALETLLEYFTRHDLHRLRRYVDNKADAGLISDLNPIIAQLYFLRRLDVSLSAMQSAILFAVGIQHHSVDDVSKEFDVPTSQLMALYQKSVKKVWTSFYALLSSEVENEVEVTEKKDDIGDDCVVTTLREEQQKAGREFNEGQIVSIKRPAEDITNTHPHKKKKKRKYL